MTVISFHDAFSRFNSRGRDPEIALSLHELQKGPYVVTFDFFAAFRIHLSEGAKEHLQTHFNFRFEARGQMEIKVSWVETEQALIIRSVIHGYFRERDCKTPIGS